MNIEQEKYLMKRIEDIRSEKIKEINEEASKKRYLKFGRPNDHNDYPNVNALNIIELRNYLKMKGKENLKIKRKIKFY